MHQVNSCLRIIFTINLLLLSFITNAEDKSTPKIGLTLEEEEKLRSMSGDTRVKYLDVLASKVAGSKNKIITTDKLRIEKFNIYWITDINDVNGKEHAWWSLFKNPNNCGEPFVSTATPSTDPPNPKDLEFTELKLGSKEIYGYGSVLDVYSGTVPFKLSIEQTVLLPRSPNGTCTRTFGSAVRLFSSGVQQEFRDGKVIGIFEGSGYAFLRRRGSGIDEVKVTVYKFGVEN